MQSIICHMKNVRMTCYNECRAFFGLVQILHMGVTGLCHWNHLLYPHRRSPAPVEAIELRLAQQLWVPHCSTTFHCSHRWLKDPWPCWPDGLSRTPPWTSWRSATWCAPAEHGVATTNAVPGLIHSCTIYVVLHQNRRTFNQNITMDRPIYMAKPSYVQPPEALAEWQCELYNREPPPKFDFWGGGTAEAMVHVRTEACGFGCHFQNLSITSSMSKYIDTHLHMCMIYLMYIHIWTPSIFAGWERDLISSLFGAAIGLCQVDLEGLGCLRAGACHQNRRAAFRVIFIGWRLKKALLRMTCWQSMVIVSLMIKWLMMMVKG